MVLNCVVHYCHLTHKSAAITPLKETTFRQVVEARNARLALGGNNLHKEQCDSIPDELDVNKHGYHRQCYGRFTNAISIAKKRNILSSEQHTETKIAKRSGQYAGKLFPKNCMICK